SQRSGRARPCTLTTTIGPDSREVDRLCRASTAAPACGATQRLASRNHSTPPLWTTLRHDAAERTKSADDVGGPTRLSRLHLPASMAGGGRLGHARARKEIRICGRRPRRCSRPPFFWDVDRETAPIQAILML